MHSIKIGALTLVLLAAVISACSPAPAEEPSESQAAVDSQETLTDPNAQLYRMFFDSETDGVQVREFVGQLRLPDFEAFFEKETPMEEDQNGNRVAGPIYVDGMVWAVKISASDRSVNLISVAPDGTASSALDLDGDRVADSVDLMLPDGRRFTFLTEALGLGLLDEILAGRNPWCNDELTKELGLEMDFGCGETDQDGGGDGAPSGGGAAGGIGGSGIIDPMDIACAGFATGNRARLLGVAPTRALIFSRTNTFIDRGEYGSTVMNTTVHATGTTEMEHVRTTRIIYHYNGDGDLIQRIDESVDANGDGTRTVTNYNEDGSVDNVQLPSTFKAKFDPDHLGQYSSDKTDPPAPNPFPPDSEEGRDEDRDFIPELQPSDANTGNQGDPGPDGDDTSLALFCANRGEGRSGVEEAAATDPTAIGVSCGELVGAPPTDDCSIIEWARPDDFLGALEPSGNNCGPFEEPDENGNCSGSDIASRLRGLTAAVISANLQGTNFCPPIVCREGFTDSAFDSREEISGEADSAPQVLSGTIRNDTLCWRGPGPDYEVVSSLFRDTVVVILGIGEDGGWFVVENPVYEGAACWTPEQDIDIDPAQIPDDLAVVEIPPLVAGRGPDNAGGSSSGGGTSPSAPSAPSNLTQKTSGFYPSCNVELTWKDNSNNEDGFYIYRDGQKIATVSANTTTFTDDKATETNGYMYEVVAFNSAGKSSSVSVHSDVCFG